MIRRYKEWRSLPAMFFEQAAVFEAKPALAAKHGGRFAPIRYGEAAARARATAAGLRRIGIAPGDRVMICSENRPEFAIAELGVLAAGAIAVPAYTTNTVQDHLYILENSGAKAAIVSTKALAERVLAAAQGSSGCGTLIAIEPWPRGQAGAVRVMAWNELIGMGVGPAGEVEGWASALSRTDTACIIYTSGTGGVPKGVMLSHGAILSNCMGAFDVLWELGLGNDVFLSFLPLSHSYEHMAGQFFPLSIGAKICYCEGAEHLGKNMVEVRPTIMTAVPRLYETLHRRITANVERGSGVARKLFERTLELGAKDFEGRLSLGERLLNRLLDFLVRRKIRARFGGRLKAFVSGGAPLSRDIALFFTALGVTLLQGYGQTESAPVIALNRPSRNKLGSVGPPVRDVTVKIADDGEILVKGELVMQGYWRDPESSAAALMGGWLHTGDIGWRDADGVITITDRKKDIIVLSGGETISPLRVEGRLTLQPEIAQAMVYGDREPYLVAVVVADSDFAKAWAAANGKAGESASSVLGALAADEDFHRALSAAVENANRTLSPIEHVRRFAIAAEPFSVANAMLTPTLKLRRHVIRENYEARLEGLYGS